MALTRHRFVAFLLAATGLLCAPFALAWDAAGHQAIGAIAERLIAGTPAATQVRGLLGLESMATSSVWADCAKGVVERPPYHYESSDRFPECLPFDTPAGRQQMVDFVRRSRDACGPKAGQEACHRQYHYADMDTALARYEGGAPGSSDHDIVAAIRAAVDVLQGHPQPAPFSIRSRKEALRLLVHWVGDLHQPLHVAGVHLDPGGRQIDAMSMEVPPDSGTHGGNLVQRNGRSLHAEWDDAPDDLGAPCCLDDHVALARAVPKSPGPMTGWPALWAGESVRASRQVFDGLHLSSRECRVNGLCAWPATATPEYGQRRVAVQRQGVLAAAARLAQLLQAVWPG